MFAFSHLYVCYFQVYISNHFIHALIFRAFLSFMCFYFSLEKPSAPRTKTKFLVFFPYHFVNFFHFCHVFLFLFWSLVTLFGFYFNRELFSLVTISLVVVVVVAVCIQKRLNRIFFSSRSLAFEIWFNKIFLRSFNKLPWQWKF